MGLVLVDSCGSSLNFTIAVLLRRCMVGESKGEQEGEGKREEGGEKRREFLPSKLISNICPLLSRYDN